MRKGYTCMMMDMMMMHMMMCPFSVLSIQYKHITSKLIKKGEKGLGVILIPYVFYD